MSVLIKGMKMPEECCVCDFMVNGMRCSALKFCDVDDAILRGERYADCPLIELPDHGDLIDRDVLRQVMRVSASCNRCERDAYKCEYYDGMTVMDVCEIIDDVPVVIPAERSEDPSHPFADSVMMGERSDDGET